MILSNAPVLTIALLIQAAPTLGAANLNSIEDRMLHEASVPMDGTQKPLGQLLAQPSANTDENVGSEFETMVLQPAEPMLYSMPLRKMPDGKWEATGNLSAGQGLLNIVTSPYLFFATIARAAHWGARQSEGAARLGIGFLGFLIGSVLAPYFMAGAIFMGVVGFIQGLITNNWKTTYSNQEVK